MPILADIMNLVERLAIYLLLVNDVGHTTTSTENTTTSREGKVMLHKVHMHEAL